MDQATYFVERGGVVDFVRESRKKDSLGKLAPRMAVPIKCDAASRYPSGSRDCPLDSQNVWERGGHEAAARGRLVLPEGSVYSVRA